MATRRRILIKDLDRETVFDLIKNQYLIGRTTVLDYERREVFSDSMNYAFIVYDAFVKGWTEIDLDFYKSVEEHDKFLKAVSFKYETTVIFGYEQTTTGDARLLVFNKGSIIRSIYQKSYHNPHRILMEDDIGDRLNHETNFLYPNIGHSVEGFKSLSFDDIQSMFEDAGYIGEKRQFSDDKYLHLEYLK